MVILTTLQGYNDFGAAYHQVRHNLSELARQMDDIADAIKKAKGVFHLYLSVYQNLLRAEHDKFESWASTLRTCLPCQKLLDAIGIILYEGVKEQYPINWETQVIECFGLAATWNYYIPNNLFTFDESPLSPYGPPPAQQGTFQRYAVMRNGVPERAIYLFYDPTINTIFYRT